MSDRGSLSILAAALPPTLLVILVLILAIRGTATLLAAALPSTLTALTTLLTTLLFTVALTGITRIRAPHNTSNAKVNVDSGELLFECRLAMRVVASLKGMKKGLSHGPH